MPRPDSSTTTCATIWTAARQPSSWATTAAERRTSCTARSSARMTTSSLVSTMSNRDSIPRQMLPSRAARFGAQTASILRTFSPVASNTRRSRPSSTTSRWHIRYPTSGSPMRKAWKMRWLPGGSRTLLIGRPISAGGWSFMLRPTKSPKDCRSSKHSIRTSTSTERRQDGGWTALQERETTSMTLAYS